MLKVIQVKSRESGKAFPFYAPEGMALSIGQEVIIPGEGGEEYGKVVSIQGSAYPEGENPESLKQIKRIATPEDKKRLEENKDKEKKVFQACLKKIEEREIPMKLVGAEYSFSQNRITFYFTAEERIDFRELVKDLAHLFKARIEMRQIGVRDEARRLGGYGCCGQPLCCATFLKEFEPVTIKMAKEQRLSLDPSKVSGICGRLLCCLAYEHKLYRELGKKMPKERTKVTTEQGEGEIVDLNILEQTVTVAFKEGQRIEIPLAKLTCPKSSGQAVKKEESSPRRRPRRFKPHRK